MQQHGLDRPLPFLSGTWHHSDSPGRVVLLHSLDFRRQVVVHALADDVSRSSVLLVKALPGDDVLSRRAEGRKLPYPSYYFPAGGGVLIPLLLPLPLLVARLEFKHLLRGHKALVPVGTEVVVNPELPHVVELHVLEDRLHEHLQARGLEVAEPIVVVAAHPLVAGQLRGLLLAQVFPISFLLFPFTLSAVESFYSSLQVVKVRLPEVSVHAKWLEPVCFHYRFPPQAECREC
mmetsp:Transcript_12573/g.23668  ORF Transcript_12573/g.23668 Transcript_12573/m.23668 type:complete len:233 (-) Transcript_12573:115-813(-)